MARYVTENRNTYPPAYIYQGMTIVGQTELPPGAVNGYIHWSALIYKRKDTSSTDSPFRTLSGWDAFQCPSIDKGGLPPTNTYPANSDGLPNDAGAGIVDMQAPRSPLRSTKRSVRGISS